MFSTFFLLSALVATTFAYPNPNGIPNCDKFPNGTDTKANWFPCDDVKNDGTIYSMKFTDTSGKEVYPIYLKSPVNVVMDVSVPASYAKITLDIDIYSWGGWSGCSWHKVPTFGLLSGLDACTNGVPCPIQSGRHTTTINLDFSKYSSIIGLLTDDSPYQLHYKLTDKATSKATCAIVQARAKTK